MPAITLADAEALAERCIDACNRVMVDDEDDALVELVSPDVSIEIVDTVTDQLTGPHELAERLRHSAYHGGLELFDVTIDGSDVVAGVAWADEPTLRIAEVRLVPRDDRIVRIEWVE